MSEEVNTEQTREDAIANAVSREREYWTNRLEMEIDYYREREHHHTEMLKKQLEAVYENYKDLLSYTTHPRLVNMDS